MTYQQKFDILCSDLLKGNGFTVVELDFPYLEQYYHEILNGSFRFERMGSSLLVSFKLHGQDKWETIMYTKLNDITQLVITLSYVIHGMCILKKQGGVK